MTTQIKSQLGYGVAMVGMLISFWIYGIPGGLIFLALVAGAKMSFHFWWKERSQIALFGNHRLVVYPWLANPHNDPKKVTALREVFGDLIVGVVMYEIGSNIHNLDPADMVTLFETRPSRPGWMQITTHRGLQVVRLEGVIRLASYIDIDDRRCNLVFASSTNGSRHVDFVDVHNL